MVHVACEMERAGLDIPIMIGGATTSEMHVAIKVAPVYHGLVVWMKDASQNALAAARLLNPQTKERYRVEIDENYRQLRDVYEQEQKQLRSLDEARNNKLNLFS